MLGIAYKLIVNHMERNGFVVTVKEMVHTIYAVNYLHKLISKLKINAVYMYVAMHPMLKMFEHYKTM